MRRNRLAIIATHPIQYYAPLFRLMSDRGLVESHVFYGWSGAAFGAVRDRGFGRDVEWDIPLLEGYNSTFVPNESSDPGTHHWNGIRSSRLLPLLREWQPDAVLLYGWNYHSHLMLMRAMHGSLPVLLRGDSTLLDERVGLRMLLRRAFLRGVYRHVDLGLYVGTHNREYFRRHGLDDSQLRWAPHSVDNDRFSDTSGRLDLEAQQWRRRLGIGADERTVLFAGKLEPKKAPDLLLRAFLERSAKDEHILIVGTGILESELKRQAARCERVHFLGFQNQSVMPVVYRLGDVFALPSRGPGETWGLAVNEAMASGRPVIVSDRVGCAPDLVAGEESGLIFASDDVGALGSSLVRLMRDLALSRQMGRVAKERIGEWTFTAQAEAIEEAVEYAITQPL